MYQRARKTAPIEAIPETEVADRREVARLTVQLQEKRKSFPTNQGQVLRGVHPKSHGCVDARFIVNKDVPRHYRRGLFRAPGKTFAAKIRYSNADVLILPDLIDGVNRSRGMAIKIMDVGPRGLLPDADGKINQDFLMINTPEFAFPDVRSYLRLSRALILDDHGADPELFFLPLKLAQMGLLNPATGQLVPAGAAEPPDVAGLRQAFQHSGVFTDFGPADFASTLQSFQIVGKIQSQMVWNPIEVPYFSAAPFRFGRGQVMRVSVAPVGDAPEQVPFSAAELAGLDPNFLAAALKKTLTAGDVHLSFRVQVASFAQLAGRVPELIEDAAKPWDEAEFPQVEVARIVVPSVPVGDGLVDACKGHFFTPWHSLAVHRPLGGINRLRRPVYNRSSTKRLGRRVTPARRTPAPRRKTSR